KGKAPGGLAWAELSTGRFLCATAGDGELAPALARLEPAELLLPEKLWASERERVLALRNETKASLTAAPDFSFEQSRAVEELHARLGVSTLQGFGFEDEKGPELAAAGALLSYLAENQRGRIAHVRA